MTNPRLAEPVPKSEAGYDAVKNRMKSLRRSGRVPYQWVEDMSRRGYHVSVYGDAVEFLRRVSHLYRADLWAQADAYVEVWCESRSIAGVILPLCRELGVSLYPSGGNTSITLAYQAALNINEIHAGRKVVIFYIGDYDPAGVLIDQALERELWRHLDGDVILEFVRLAVTKEQIEEYDLPTKPRKKGEKRAPHVTETVEAEAMPATELCRVLRGAVEALLPPRALEVTRAAEESERDVLQTLARTMENSRRAAGGPSHE
jgi:hypothetical protein